MTEKTFTKKELQDIEFSNKYCGTKIAIPNLDWSDTE